ncbi:UNKNOWN [Stylonychia lemnae]|uniref:Uncharacterized protein n=1 Tax=Stylonychia lemnae TaxID=5949 RepID=A0A077ZTF1_STYLE|nr:UNKNOWN [Stylonychia lemnae]|eukprot:CDW72610.1 UNKNOWN [Stylonychia lemnae]
MIFRLWIKEKPEPLRFNFRIPETIIYNNEASLDKLNKQYSQIYIDLLEKFIFEEDKLHLDLLVEYIPSSKPKNTVIKCSWTPSMCMIESRENNCNQNDDNFQMIQRVVTYEGPLGLSNQQKVISNYTIKEIEKACLMIQEKLAQSDIIVQQAIYFFKIKKSILYLIGCQNIHIEGDQHKNKVSFDKFVYQSVPEEQRLELFKDIKTTNLEIVTNQQIVQKEPSFVDEIEQINQIQCVFCDKKLKNQVNENFEFIIKQIMTLYEQYLKLINKIISVYTDLFNEQEESERTYYYSLKEKIEKSDIPYPIRQIYPVINLQQYQKKMSETQYWIYDSVQTCQGCYKKIIGIQEEIQNNNLIKANISNKDENPKFLEIKKIILALSNIWLIDTSKTHLIHIQNNVTTYNTNEIKTNEFDQKLSQKAIDLLLTTRSQRSYQQNYKTQIDNFVYSTPVSAQLQNLQIQANEEQKLQSQQHQFVSIDPAEICKFIDRKMVPTPRADIVRQNISAQSKRLLLTSQSQRPKSQLSSHRTHTNKSNFQLFKESSKLPDLQQQSTKILTVQRIIEPRETFRQDPQVILDYLKMKQDNMESTTLAIGNSVVKLPQYTPRLQFSQHNMDYFTEFSNPYPDDKEIKTVNKLYKFNQEMKLMKHQRLTMYENFRDHMKKPKSSRNISRVKLLKTMVLPQRPLTDTLDNHKETNEEQEYSQEFQ